ncbi:holin [Paenibacillus albiflavus]|uniref:Holin n=1 Tax=Paenibacillus albiflavus TaxID=2545760 RepID=A0A4R4EDJ4_9BACL|nr:phage holin family protein [Paenibacillus albiflavus]TCZ76058.1 holin [Paenibacillus albiflavus]
MDKWKVFFGSVGAVLVPIFEFMYGDGEAVITLMTALLFFVIMDWISGIRAAKKDNTYSSRYGLVDGLPRTFFILLLPAGGHFLDAVFGLPSIIFGVFAMGTLYHIMQSMIANSIRAGWGDWLPIPILNKIIDWVKSELDQKIERAESRKVSDKQ